ncbi:response regulator [Aliamphritea spongicola]|nr:response regulator [Aliamphritea spongicola]
MKILLAEDDVVNAEYIRKGLIEKGFVVDWVTDGREALTYCLYNQCDLFIADRMLPGMDGLSVVKALRASGSQLPVIFLTAMSDVDDKVEGLLAGGDDYMVKPFHFSELLARITVLSRRPGESTEKLNWWYTISNWTFLPGWLKGRGRQSSSRTKSLPCLSC